MHLRVFANAVYILSKPGSFVKKRKKGLSATAPEAKIKASDNAAGGFFHPSVITV